LAMLTMAALVTATVVLRSALDKIS